MKRAGSPARRQGARRRRCPGPCPGDTAGTVRAVQDLSGQHENRALSRITNEFLQDIGSDIRIRFDGYTVLKSGKVREKISISLLRDGMDCGSFGKFSAGEAARVNLATILPCRNS